MNFKALKAFSIVVNQGSLSAAARQLNLSQPSVSRLISLLEAETGLTLFHRTKRRLILSQEGEAFFEEIKPTIAGIEEIPRIVQDVRQANRQFKLVVTQKIAQGLISPALAALRDQQPDLGIVVDVETRFRFETLVGIKRFDLAIASLPLPLSTAAIESQPLFSTSTVVLLPNTHPLVKKQSLTAMDLASQPLIGLRPDQLWRQQIDEFMTAGGVSAHYAVETRHVLMACQMVRDGLGLTFTDRVTAQAIDLDGLTMRKLRPERWTSFGYVSQRDRPLTDNAILFIDCVRDVISRIRQTSPENAQSIELFDSSEHVSTS